MNQKNRAPKILVFFSSYRCDSRCTMCYTWIKQRWSPELSVDQIDQIFSDPMLGNELEILNMTGGEPTSRPDMVEIVKVILNRCRGLKRIDIPTNGINSEEVIDKIEQILALLAPRKIRLALTVSIDGVGEVHEKVRGVRGIFSQILETVGELKELVELHGSRMSLGFNTTLGKLNHDRASEMLAFSREHGVGINFTPAAISEVGVESSQMKEHFMIDQVAHESLAQFYDGLVEEKVVAPEYAHFVTHWLRTGKRIGSCAFKEGKTVLLEPEGNVYLCGNYKEYQFGNLLYESFSEAWPKALHLQEHADWSKCQTCPSNCYFDEGNHG